jgi:hypothetical protein
MKTNRAMNCSLPALLLLAIALFTGCAALPPVDWDSRVGNYNYAQALQELGPPNRQIRLSTGATKFKWFIQPDGSTGMGYPGMNNGFGMGQNFSPGYSDRCLQLTFDTNGVLSAWSKNY